MRSSTVRSSVFILLACYSTVHGQTGHVVHGVGALLYYRCNVKLVLVSVAYEVPVGREAVRANWAVELDLEYWACVEPGEIVVFVTKEGGSTIR